MTSLSMNWILMTRWSADELAGCFQRQRGRGGMRKAGQFLFLYARYRRFLNVDGQVTGERDLSEQSASRADLGDSRERECADVVLDGCKMFRQVRRAHGEQGCFLRGPAEDYG